MTPWPDPEAAEFTMGIVGAGVMGRGVAQLAAEAGLTVLLTDAKPGAAAQAKAFCADMIGRKAAKGSITSAAAEVAVARIEVPEDGPYAGFERCHLVLEAVTERMEVKHAVLADVEAVVSERCLIATNTSSLSVAAFAARARRPERVAGYHFFNPVPLMKLVEVIPGVLTAPEVVDALTALTRRLGHRPVRASDTPGFLVNHAGRGFGTEALRIVSERIAGYGDVDRVMVDAAGFRMGPFELMDLVGLDVSHAVIESIYRQYYEEPRYRPVAITAQLTAAGLFGRKTGRGFYAYDDGRPARPAEPAPPPVDGRAFWIGAADPDAHRALSALAAAAGASIDHGERPGPDCAILVSPLGRDATTTALAEGLDPERTVAVDAFLGLDRGRRRTMMTTPVTRPEVRDAAHALLAADGTAVTAIQDSPGFIAPRIIACIVNVAADMAQQGIATPGDIDRAVEVGLGYPVGSLAWGDRLGPRRVLAVLEGLHDFYGDPRYRPSPWLKRRALLDAPLSPSA